MEMSSLWQRRASWAPSTDPGGVRVCQAGGRLLGRRDGAACNIFDGAAYCMKYRVFGQCSCHAYDSVLFVCVNPQA